MEKDFSCAMLSATSKGTSHRAFPVKYCPKSIKTTLMLSAASWATFHKVFTCAMLSQTYYNNIEHDFSHAMLSGQHCTRFLPVQCCRKRIKTRLSRIFSCAMLSGASRATLPRVFTCEMLSQEY